MGLCSQSAFCGDPWTPRALVQGVLSAAGAPLRAGTKPGRKTASFFAAGRWSRRARITSPPAGRSMTDNQAQALQVEPSAGGVLGRCIVDRRPQTAPAVCGPNKGLRCLPGGSAPRASRGARRLTPRLRSSGRLPSARPPAAPSLRAGGARKRACLWPSAQRRKAVRRCTQPPRQPVGAGVAPGAKRRLSRRLHKAAGLSRRSHAPPGVLPGGDAPRTPRPPAAGGPRARRRCEAMRATGTPAAPLTLARKTRQGSHRTRGTLRAHGFNPAQARRRATPARRPRPGGPSCARPLRRRWRARIQRALAPAAAGRRGPPWRVQGLCGGHGSHAGAGAARAGTPAGARLAGRPGTCSGMPASASTRVLRPIAGGAPPPPASKGGLVPPWTPQPSAYGARQRCTPAQPGPVPHGLQPAGAGVLPAARRWHRGRCPSCGPLVRPGFAPRPVPRPARPWPSSASTPLASLRAAARPAAPGV